MQTRSLQELKANSLVIRTEYAENPPLVEYSLTKTGQNLMPALQ